MSKIADQRSAFMQSAAIPDQFSNRMDFRSFGLEPGWVIEWPQPLPGFDGQPPEPPGRARIVSITANSLEIAR